MASQETTHPFQPTFSRTYQFEHLKILPQDYGPFLAACTEMYLKQSSIISHKQQKESSANFSLFGIIIYQTASNQTKKVCKSHNIQNQMYTEPLGTDHNLKLDNPLFAEKIQTRVDIVNTQLDDRFPQSKSRFPQTYLQHHKLLSTSIELNALTYYKTTSLHSLNIHLKAQSTTATGLESKKYIYFLKPFLTIELRDNPAQLSNLEQLAANLEQELHTRYV